MRDATAMSAEAYSDACEHREGTKESLEDTGTECLVGEASLSTDAGIVVETRETGRTGTIHAFAGNMGNSSIEVEGQDEQSSTAVSLDGEGSAELKRVSVQCDVKFDLLIERRHVP